ncbi:conserved hypothetical protein [Ricinus communis]|uniref:Uncharacterized protein n=1 Tax=Ricinus communis TaxID=3988 RepID=B9SJT9_RICCO|nr:conserved hypothetical protein [Ricinus communis]
MSRSKHDGCGFFEWLNLELLPFQKSYFVRLKAERETLQEQLRCKAAIENLLVEKLTLKDVELEMKNELSIKNAKMERKIGKLYKKKKQLRDDNRNFRDSLRAMKVISSVVVVLVVGLILLGEKMHCYP